MTIYDYTSLMEYTLPGHDLQRDLSPPYVDDALLEIVGFKDAWHGLVLLAPKGHGTRLAQVCNGTCTELYIWLCFLWIS